MADVNFVHILKQELRKHKLQEAEFYGDLESFSSFQIKEEEEVVAVISYGLVEQCDNTKLRKYPKCRTGTNQTKNHFGPPYILNDVMRNLKTNFEFILNHAWAMIVKQSTNMIRNPIEEHRQLYH